MDLFFFYDSKLYRDTGDFLYAIVGNAPFLVEKKSGRIVIFGTAHPNDYYIEAYENGTLMPSKNRYWYPSTQTYSDK